VKGLDTNVLVRFLVNDDRHQGLQVKELFLEAERTGDPYKVTMPVILELIWVLGSVYDFQRQELLRAVELLTQMPVLEFEDYDALVNWIRLGRSTSEGLADLLIGVTGKAAGCKTTLTFDQSLNSSGLFSPVA
jgi:predicted nucleic-acid-binding protein